MRSLDIPGLLAAAARIAVDAGRAIREIYDGEAALVADTKADGSPLTLADMAAHAVIVSGLKALTPDVPILSEEAVAEFSGPDERRRYWLVDPLDGTREFVKRNGEFTVNIALIEAGIPMLGVVHAPVLDVTYEAAVGVGAFRTDASGRRVSIQVAAHDSTRPWRVVGSRSHAGDSLAEFLQRLGPHELVPMGSSLKLCLVAEGKADLYPRLGPTSLWDTAAAQCVVEQAGGRVIAPDGTTLSYANPQQTLNPHFLVCGRDAQEWPAFLATSGRS